MQVTDRDDFSDVNGFGLLALDICIPDILSFMCYIAQTKADEHHSQQQVLCDL